VTTTSSVVSTQDQKINNTSIDSDSEDSLSIKNEEKERISPNKGEINPPPKNIIESNAPPPDKPTIPSNLTDQIDPENIDSELNQSDLAKRLEVHSTTISKRKSESDFSIWSQTKDPEGIAWQYVEERKVFVGLEVKPESS
jgi:hypothetical protein